MYDGYLSCENLEYKRLCHKLGNKELIVGNMPTKQSHRGGSCDWRHCETTHQKFRYTRKRDISSWSD